MRLKAVAEFILRTAVLFSFFFVIVTVIRFLCLRKREVDRKRERVLRFFLAFVCTLLALTLLPRITWGSGGVQVIWGEGHGSVILLPFRTMRAAVQSVVIGKKATPFLINIVGNIIMLLPIGFCVPYLWHTSGKTTVALGAAFSLAIELCQLATPRHSDVDDLILNTLGVFLGFLLFLHKKRTNKYIGDDKYGKKTI